MRFALVVNPRTGRPLAWLEQVEGMAINRGVHLCLRANALEAHEQYVADDLIDTQRTAGEFVMLHARAWLGDDAGVQLVRRFLGVAPMERTT